MLMRSIIKNKRARYPGVPRFEESILSLYARAKGFGKTNVAMRRFMGLI
ncbi:MAG: hypothetical protein RL333_584 [Pseudomonadota bacterium]|jgi:hypothetical protein